MQIFAILNKRILFHPFFLSSSFLVIYTDTNKAKKTRIDSLISVLRARGNGSVNFRKFLASVRHDFAGLAISALIYETKYAFCTTF